MTFFSDIRGEQPSCGLGRALIDGTKPPDAKKQMLVREGEISSPGLDDKGQRGA